MEDERLREDPIILDVVGALPCSLESEQERILFMPARPPPLCGGAYSADVLLPSKFTAGAAASIDEVAVNGRKTGVANRKSLSATCSSSISHDSITSSASNEMSSAEYRNDWILP